MLPITHVIAGMIVIYSLNVHKVTDCTLFYRRVCHSGCLLRINNQEVI